MERAKPYRAVDMKTKAMTHGIALGQRYRYIVYPFKSKIYKNQ